MIEFRQISNFLSAPEHGSFRKSASTVGVNELAVSRRIRDLEDQLGSFSGTMVAFARRWQGNVLFIMRKVLRQIGQGAKHVAAIGRSDMVTSSLGFSFP